MNITEKFENLIGATAILVLKSGEQTPIGPEKVDYDKRQLVCLSKRALQEVRDKKRSLTEIRQDANSYLVFDIDSVASIITYKEAFGQ